MITAGPAHPSCSVLVTECSWALSSVEHKTSVFIFYIQSRYQNATSRRVVKNACGHRLTPESGIMAEAPMAHSAQNEH